MNYKTLLLSLASAMATALYAHEPYADMDAYIATHLPYAKQQCLLEGIPISFTLGQGYFESAGGESELAIHASNFFGIKANNWNGLPYHKDTQEEEDGKMVIKKEPFRRYGNLQECYDDRSIFLRASARYQHLFNLTSTDYVGWAQGIQQAGYATNSQYANRIINIIQKHKLHQFDILLDKSEIAMNKERLRAQFSMTRISPNQDHNPTQINSISSRLETISAASERESKYLQTQIDILKQDQDKIKDKESERYKELYRRLNELTELVNLQQKHIADLNLCIYELERHIGKIYQADPLKFQYTPDGRPRKQLEIYPITTNPENKDIFIINAKRVVNLPKESDILALAQEHNIEVRNILEYNDLRIEDLSNPQIMLPNLYIYLEPKPNSTDSEAATHTVRAGETMHAISQLYGVKLNRLAQRNYINLDNNEQPQVGQIIYINKKAPFKPLIQTKQDASHSFGSGGTAKPSQK